MDYAKKKSTEWSFEEAIEKVKASLKEQGFGVLTEIDVKDTLRNKLDVDFRKYAILGACNPPNAYKALQAEQDIGLMLPCNVIVYEKDGKTIIAAIRPTVAMGMIDNEELKTIAEDIEKRLEKAIDDV